MIDLAKRLIRGAWLSLRGAWRFVIDNFWDCFFPLGLGVVVVLLILFAAVAERLGVLGTEDPEDPEPMDERVRAFSVRGEPHEYLDYDRGITHLPNCKYCKGETK